MGLRDAVAVHAYAYGNQPSYTRYKPTQIIAAHTPVQEVDHQELAGTTFNLSMSFYEAIQVPVQALWTLLTHDAKEVVT